MIKNDAVERANGNLILDWLDTFERKSQTNKQTNGKVLSASTLCV